MTSWRSLVRALPWMVAPALSIGACGHTDRAADPNATGTAGSSSSTGGTTLLPVPSGGMTGRAGSAPIPEAGAGGTMPMIMVPGISQVPKTLMCGGKTCTSVSTLAGVFVDPCCAADGCGVDTQFLAGVGAKFADQCQATGQKGERDASCPTSAPQMLPFMGMSLPVPGFVGCCRAETGTCGVIVDQLTVSGFPLASPQLGCVDSAPFFANQPGAACGEPVGGAGGAAGAGAGGEPSGGAGGEAGASGEVVGGAGGAR